MATVRMIAKERLRARLAKKGKAKREELKAVISSQNVDYVEKLEAVLQLNKRKRDESPSRGRNRCRVCGRARGVYRKFGLCRLHVREAVVKGYIPGMRKASW